MRRPPDPGTLAIAVAKSHNAKIGVAATTYAAQTSCPSDCVFKDGGGCYAEAGSVGKFVTAPLNEAANSVEHTPSDVALAEAHALDDLEVVPGRPLRLHTVGDCPTEEAARFVASAAAWYRARGGGPVWTYTHAWRTVPRAAWGDVSVLASCETPADAELARSRGYATAMVVEEFGDDRLSDGVLPCPSQTRGVPCSECRLCFDDRGLFERGYSIGFELHGTPFTVRQGRKALLTPGDPDRKLTSRELIPRVEAQLEAESVPVTNAEIARRLDMAYASVAEMRESIRLGRQVRDPARGRRRRKAAA